VTDYTKNELRSKILKLLKDQKEEDLFRKSTVIGEKLFETEEFKQARTVLFYASFDKEVHTLEMIRLAQKLNKIIALPAFQRFPKEIQPRMVNDLDKDLITGPYGIQQPCLERTEGVCLDDLDCVVVPGVVFDKNNFRIGRGGGYYDRFLASLSKKVSSLGLAFDFQLVDFIPCLETHDLPVSKVITN